MFALYELKTVFCLGAVARGKSLFGDPANEIQELTGIIKQDIAKLNSDIAYLQDVSLVNIDMCTVRTYACMYVAQSSYTQGRIDDSLFLLLASVSFNAAN
jgi:hypothetical protein